MKVLAIHCKSCNDTIYSRAHYDCRECTCFNDTPDNKGCYIDGGQDEGSPISMGGHADSYFTLTIDLGDEVTKEVLYADWNNETDLYGLIKNHVI